MNPPTLVYPQAVDSPSATPDPPAGAHQQCDECAAPVAADQRYCVVCGAHRRNVEDPAARYLAQAVSRERTIAHQQSTQRPRRGRDRALGLGTALILAATPVAAGIGVLAGRSSNNGDAALLHALSNQNSADSALLQGLSRQSTTPVAAATTAATSSTHTGGKGKTRHAKGSAASSGGSGSSTSALSSAKPSQSQVQQGAQVVQKIQKSAGKGYVNSQSGLPSTIVVP